MTESIFDTLLDYIDQGGFVMPPLVLMTFVLWYTVGARLMNLRRGSAMPLRKLVGEWRSGARHAEPHGLIDQAARHAVRVAGRYREQVTEALDDALFPYYCQVKTGRTLILGIVTIAPLIGLLGTVSGMIETFDSLGDMSLHSASGGIAGGIAQALFSTQMGLCVAVPGVIAGRLLDRRQRRFEEELDQIKALLGGAK